MSTPRRGFPGGIIDASELTKMVRGEGLTAMQCHCTPDTSPEVCVGFAMQVGWLSPAYRLAVCLGLVEPEGLETDEELHTVESLLLTHGGVTSPEA